MSRRTAVLMFLVLLPLHAGSQALFENTVESTVLAMPLTARPVTQAPARIDLSWQFSDAGRSQGHLSSCHAFTAVALIEAAYFRQYGRRARLSEADLFVHRNAAPALPFLRSREGGLLRPDLHYALKHGVMTGDYYEAFEERYHAFKKRFDKFLDKKSSVISELLPESATPEAGAAREKIREEIREFRVGGESFFKFIGAAARSTIKQDAVSCDAHRVSGMIEGQLNRGLPVGLGLNSGWTKSPAWRRDSEGEGGSHYFVVLGYTRAETGTVFHTRNSWSEGGSPDLAGQDLCEVFGMSWVRTPLDPD